MSQFSTFELVDIGFKIVVILGGGGLGVWLLRVAHWVGTVTTKLEGHDVAIRHVHKEVDKAHERIDEVYARGGGQ